MRFHPSSISAALWIDQDFRADDARLISTLLRPGDTYVDIGANVGQLALEAALTVGRSGVVHAFEPHPRIFTYLRRNVALNRLRNVTLHQTALGDKSHLASFEDRRSDDQNALADNGRIEVPVVRLDDVALPASIRLLKIDVEGAEPMVLAGAARTLAHCDLVLFEHSPQRLYEHGFTLDDVKKPLLAHGFQIYHTRRAHERGGDAEDLIAVRSDLVTEITARIPLVEVT